MIGNDSELTSMVARILQREGVPMKVSAHADDLGVTQMRVSVEQQIASKSGSERLTNERQEYER